MAALARILALIAFVSPRGVVAIFMSLPNVILGPLGVNRNWIWRSLLFSQTSNVTRTVIGAPPKEEEEEEEEVLFFALALLSPVRVFVLDGPPPHVCAKHENIIIMEEEFEVVEYIVKCSEVKRVEVCGFVFV